MQNGNGFAHGVTPTRAGKEHEGRKLPLNHIGNASEHDYRKSDGVNLSEVIFFFLFSLGIILLVKT